MQVRRPSPLWAITGAAAAIAAASLVLAGFTHHRNVNTPIGEGQLFVRDATTALAMVDPSDDPSLTVRQIRNDLRIEAVSYVSPDGMIVASTADGLVGEALANGVLGFGLSQGRFVAVATPIAENIAIDGIVEWRPGDVLYRVLQPTNGGAVLLDYDISELLARRSSNAGVTNTTVRLYLLALAFAVVAAAAVIGRNRTARHNREIAREAELMRLHTDELEHTNAELDRARTAAERALELAEEKNRVRAEFVLMINHELRTPLTAVVTGADLLRSDPEMPAASREEILNAMVLDGGRLEEMIDQMLAVARIENRGLNVEMAPVSGNDVCLDVVSRDQDILHHGHAVELPVAISDRVTLTQLIHSLVDNARSHGASEVRLQCTSGVPFDPQIEVGVRPQNALTFVITDNGPGISPEFLPRIFEKYEKDSFSSGTGLGLYLARMMIEALDGSIAVSTSPHGTKMAVTVQATAAAKRNKAVAP